ncbi:unnamed protein product [Dovyalis caffra]|uniref:Uncharacterized protein n=1 Tax=Dovyalis caffra TaxID=77055 RepID=A0AAV1R5H0_9ROSI|nr:unnamed protein product [Dovyalis caffra]
MKGNTSNPSLRTFYVLEERERGVQRGDSNTEKPDLKQERSENKEEHESEKPVLVSGEESDRENQAVNESNSTESDGKGGVEDAWCREEEGGGDCGGEESCELGDSGTQWSGESEFGEEEEEEKEGQKRSAIVNDGFLFE